MNQRLVRNAGCAMTSTEVGLLVCYLDGYDELFRLKVSSAEWLLTDHKIIDAAYLAELSAQGLLSEMRRIATFSISHKTKLIIHGVDQPVVNLGYHGWPVFEAGNYAVFAARPERPPHQLFVYAHSRPVE